ncbi:MAG: ComF family protein [Candidatus Sericytochromatia bacterium]
MFFFIKKQCVLCSRFSKDFICIACFNQFQKLKTPFCNICKGNFIENSICKECEKRIPLFENLFTLGAYNGLLKTVIYNLKYDGIKKLSNPLGKFLAEEIKNKIDLKKIDYVTSIPVSKEKLKKRGFNQAELIALSVSKTLIKPYKQILKRHKETEAQHSLSATEREENLKSAFSLNTKKNLAGKNILIIDDIFTTGSTIQETCRVLKTYDINKIYVGVVARTLL